MSLPEPTNEQKLTYIYYTLKAQEDRRKKKFYLGILKWVIIFTLVYLGYTYRSIIGNELKTYIQESINTQIKKISDEQKSGILKGVQQLIPPSLEDTLREVQKSFTEPPQTPVTKTGSTKASTGVVKPGVKK